MKWINAEHIRTVKKPFICVQQTEFNVNFSMHSGWKWRKCLFLCCVSEL